MSKAASKTRPTVRRLIKTMQQAGFTVHLASERELLARMSRGARPRQIGARVMGVIAPDEYAILVNERLALEERVRTVLHELIHLDRPELSESETERTAQSLFKHLNDHDLGLLEFLVS